MIDLIGRISEPFDWTLGDNLKHTTVRFQSNLRPRDFYRSIHRAKYLIAAIDNRCDEGFLIDIFVQFLCFSISVCVCTVGIVYSFQ